MLDHHRRRMYVGLMAALVMCAVTACMLTGIAVQQRGVAGLRFDQQFGSVRIIGYTTWNAHCPPFTGCEATTKQSYVVWVMASQPGAAGVMGTSWQMLAVPLELPW